MKFFFSLMLKTDFNSHLTWKLSWTPFYKWSPLFQWTWTRLNFQIQKGLPYCTAGYETWFTKKWHNSTSAFDHKTYDVNRNLDLFPIRTLDTTRFVLLSVFTLIETVFPRFEREYCPSRTTPVDLHRSKTSARKATNDFVRQVDHTKG